MLFFHSGRIVVLLIGGNVLKHVVKSAGNCLETDGAQAMKLLSLCRLNVRSEISHFCQVYSPAASKHDCRLRGRAFDLNG